MLRLVAASDPPTRTQLADAAAALVEDLSDNPGCGAGGAGFDVGSWICFHHYGAVLYETGVELGDHDQTADAVRLGAGLACAIIGAATPAAAADAA